MPLVYGYGDDGGPATSALIRAPLDLDVDPDGNLLVTDYDDFRIRKATGLNHDAPPTAVAGVDQSIHAGSAVLVDGSAS